MSLALPQKRKILIIDEFLDQDLCALASKEFKNIKWNRSKTITDNRTQVLENQVTEYRTSTTSYQEWFSPELMKVISKVEQLLTKTVPIELQKCEPWQALRYGLDEKYEYHIDGGAWKNREAGEREYTILIYLNTPTKGGQTHFRALNQYVNAVAGRCVIWDNLLPNKNCDYAMIHSARPVLRGVKKVFVTWQRERKFRKS